MVMNGPGRRRRDGTIHHEQSAIGGVWSLIVRLVGYKVMKLDINSQIASGRRRRKREKKRTNKKK